MGSMEETVLSSEKEQEVDIFLAIHYSGEWEALYINGICMKQDSIVVVDDLREYVLGKIVKSWSSETFDDIEGGYFPDTIEELEELDCVQN